MIDGRGDNVGSAGLSPDMFCYFSFFPFALMLFVALCFKVRLDTDSFTHCQTFLYMLMSMHLFSDDNLIQCFNQR